MNHRPAAGPVASAAPAGARPASRPVSCRDHADLGAYLEAAGEWIQAELMRRLPDTEPDQYLYALLRDYPRRGGKRFRSALVLLCCELFGGAPEDALVSAVAYEMFHNFALMHDDIEDDSLFRRGRPTLHREVGVPLALNAGDSMLGMVFETLLENRARLGAERTMAVLEHFCAVMRKTFEGQAIDIGWFTYDRFPSRAEYQAMITRKTGWYSGRGPGQTGAMIAGAPPAGMEAIGRFGEAIGIGFQARDDLLNLTTRSETEAPTHAQAGGYGKERGGDVAEGKRTLITIELFERLPPDEADRLHGILVKPRERNTEEEVEWVIGRAEASGALEAVARYCGDHAAAARAALADLPDHPARDLIRQLVDYLAVDRKF